MSRKPGQISTISQKLSKKRHFTEVSLYNLKDPDELQSYITLINDPSIIIEKEKENFSAVSGTMILTIWYHKTKKEDAR